MTRTRRLILAALILLLASASLDSPYSAYAYLRWPAAIAFVALTILESTAQPMPHLARRFMAAGWGFAVLGGVSAFWSIGPSESATQAAAFALLLAALHVNLQRTWQSADAIRSDLRAIFWPLAAISSATMLIPDPVMGRSTGLYVNPNALGLAAGAATIIGVGLVLQRMGPVVLAATVTSAAALILSGARTPIIALGCALVWIVLRRPLHPVAFAAYCFTGAAAATFLLFGNHIPLGRFAEQDDDALNGRTQAWDAAIRLWEYRPFTGYGFRSQEIVFGEQARYLGYDVAHSSYIQVLLELGWLGVIAGALMLTAIARILIPLRASGVGTAVGGLVIFGLVSGITESSLFGFGQASAWAFWIGAGMLAATAARSTTSEPRPATVTPAA